MQFLKKLFDLLDRIYFTYKLLVLFVIFKTQFNVFKVASISNFFLSLSLSLVYYPADKMANPRSTTELANLATVSVDPNQAIRLYFRSADQILKQARVYKLEHDLEHAYIFYMKYTK